MFDFIFTTGFTLNPELAFQQYCIGCNFQFAKRADDLSLADNKVKGILLVKIEKYLDIPYNTLPCEILIKFSKVRL